MLAHETPPCASPSLPPGSPPAQGTVLGGNAKDRHLPIPIIQRKARNQEEDLRRRRRILPRSRRVLRGRAGRREVFLGPATLPEGCKRAVAVPCVTPLPLDPFVSSFPLPVPAPLSSGCPSCHLSPPPPLSLSSPAANLAARDSLTCPGKRGQGRGCLCFHPAPSLQRSLRDVRQRPAALPARSTFIFSLFLLLSEPRCFLTPPALPRWGRAVAGLVGRRRDRTAEPGFHPWAGVGSWRGTGKGRQRSRALVLWMEPGLEAESGLRGGVKAEGCSGVLFPLAAARGSPAHTPSLLVPSCSSSVRRDGCPALTSPDRR